MKDKLVSFPEEILIALENYRKKTGIPATDYIRNAVCRKMIEDKLIFIRTKYITIETKNEEHKTIPQAAPQEILYCDSESCNIQMPQKTIGIKKKKVE